MTALPAGMALFFVAAGDARHADVVAGHGPRVRARHRLRSRRVCPRPCPDRAALEPRRVCAARQRRDDAARLAVRRLCLESARRAPVRESCFDLRRQAVRLPRAGSAGLPRGRPAHRAWRRRLCGASDDSRTPTAPARVSACASSRPTSIRPRNGAPRTAPRSSPTISTSPSRGRPGSTASPRRSGRRRRCRFFSPIPPKRCSPSATRCPRGPRCSSARRVSSRSATRKARLTATRIYNSLLVIDDKGEVARQLRQDPSRPVRRISARSRTFWRASASCSSPACAADSSAGTGPRLLAIPGAPPASPLICYEIIFPDDVVEPNDAAGLAAQHHQRCLVRLERRTVPAFPSGPGARGRARACRSCAPPIPGSRR